MTALPPARGPASSRPATPYPRDLEQLCGAPSGRGGPGGAGKLFVGGTLASFQRGRPEGRVERLAAGVHLLLCQLPGTAGQPYGVALEPLRAPVTPSGSEGDRVVMVLFPARPGSRVSVTRRGCDSGSWGR